MSQCSLVDELLNRKDRKLENSKEERRCDYIAMLITGINVCSAVCLRNRRLIIANNTGENGLVLQYMKLLEKWIFNQNVTKKEKDDLIKETLKGAQELYRKNQCLNNDKYTYEEIKALDIHPKTNFKIGESKIDREAQVLEKVREESYRELYEEEKKSEAEKQPLDDKVKELQLEINDVDEDMDDQTLTKNALLKLRKKKVELTEKMFQIESQVIKSSKRILNLKTKIQETEKELEPKLELLEKRNKILTNIENNVMNQRGSGLLKKLEKCMTKVLNWIRESSPIDKENIYVFVKNPAEGQNEKLHAEMSVIQSIYQSVEGKWNTISENIYIGLNKLCCIQCSLTIRQINEQQEEEKGVLVEKRGDHNKLYEPWYLPPFFRKMGLKTMEEYFKEKEIHVSPAVLKANNKYDLEESICFVSDGDEDINNIN